MLHRFILWFYTRSSLLSILREYESRIDQLNRENAELQRGMLDSIERLTAERTRLRHKIDSLRIKAHFTEDMIKPTFFYAWFKENYATAGKRIIGKDADNNVVYDSEAHPDLNISHLLWKRVLAVVKYDTHWEITLGD